MTLLAVERIKLFTTRSPLWCTLIALGITVGFAALIAGVDNDNPVTVASTQFGYNFGLVVVMVMAALAITTEYRFSTLKATFQAIPNRTAVLAAKTTVVALFAGLIGLVAAFGSLAISMAIKPGADLALNTEFEWRTVAGVGLVYAFAAVIAVAVGTLIRHSAGAISVLLIWNMLVESLISLIPKVGDNIQKWMPFTNANKFLTGNADITARSVNDGPGISNAPLSPWAAVAYFAGIAIVLLIVSIVVTNKRDA
jgi:ABC-2 type transport system permease protein